MREATSSITIFEIMIAFTLLFAAFLAVAINYNRAYRIKNESIAIIEKYENPSSTAISIINDYLANSRYQTKGDCKDGEFGVSSLSSTSIVKVSEGTKYYYCLSYSCNKRGEKCRESSKEIIYSVRFFFKFSLPFFGELSTFSVTGDTKTINVYNLSKQIISG